MSSPGDSNRAIVSVLEFGATGNGNTDDTAAIQSAIDHANQIGAAVFFPSAMYRVSQIVLRKGTILQGVSSGTYPDNNAIPGASVLARLANTNKHLILAPDGADYGRIFDLAIDGNKNNNTAGYGLCVADGTSGEESQIVVERCYFHDNPDSNVYLGKGRRANSVQDGVFNYSLKGDGITVAGSDNTITGNIFGTNARAGSLVQSGGGGLTVNGVPGATAGARFVGGTKSGAPTSGTWSAGDFAIDQTGKVWIYTGSAWVASHS